LITSKYQISIKYLWNSKRAREKSIGEAIGSEADNFRLTHVFRQKDKKIKMHPAWGTMIVPDGKGGQGKDTLPKDWTAVSI